MEQVAGERREALQPWDGPRGTDARAGFAHNEVGRPTDLVWAWLAALAAVYLVTLRPTIGWNDAPEFVVVAQTLGIAHPPGSPTWALLAKLVTLLPIGSVTVRVHIFSMICALGAVVLVLSSVRLLHARLGGAPRAGTIGGILAGTLLALGSTYWRYATQAEVYAPFAFFVALLLYLSLKWEQTRDEPYLLIGAFIFGLSGGIHGTIVFCAPAFAWLVLTKLPREGRVRALLRVLVFGILGGSVYLYLPLRAGTEPSINWGHPDTFTRFWAHISDRKDAMYHFPAAKTPWWPYIKMFARNVNAEVSAAGWGAALLGPLLLARRLPRVALFTLLLALGNILFFLRTWIIPDAYMPTFVVLAFWAGLALSCVFEPGARRRRVVAVVCGAAVLFALSVQARKGALKAAVEAQDEARSAVQWNLLPLDSDAMVFATTNWFGLRFLQDVEGMRPDVTILLYSDFARPDYFNPISNARFPKIAIPKFRDRSSHWGRFLELVIQDNLPRLPIYWEPIDLLDPQAYPYLHPWRYLWRFSMKKPGRLTNEEVQAYMVDLRSFLERELDAPIPASLNPAARPRAFILGAPDTVIYHASLIAESGEIFRLNGRLQDAAALLELGRLLTPNNPALVSKLGLVYRSLGRSRDAEGMFRLAMVLAPQELMPRVNLAVVEISMNRYDEARRTLMDAIAIGPRVPETYYQLSVLERKLGRRAEAGRAIKKAIFLSTKPEDRRAWRTELAELKTQGGGDAGSGLRPQGGAASPR